MRRYLMLLILCVPAAANAQEFTYNPSGELTPGSGTGRADDMVYVPDMRFPIEVAPAYPNSQVWGNGGSQGGGGGQCDPVNYSYPWWDNYCESRSWEMPLCPSGTGHQGQDIRASTCDKSTHWVVASESGQITDIGTYSVWLVSDGGTQHRYLHMDMAQLAVTQGQRVAMGDRLGMVSNDFGGTPTTIHMHYDINQNIPAAGGNVYVPTYMSLVRSYETLIGMEAVPCGVIPAEGGIVDEDGPCATLFGNPEFWRAEPGGNDGQYHWTNAFVSDNPSNWARWALNFAEAGRYNVEFNVVPPNNVSKKARYLVQANGEETVQEVDQSTIDEWFSLGEFEFAEGGAQKIELYDNTGETADDQHITADAIRLTRLDGSTTNNTTGGNNGTNSGTTGNNNTGGGSNNGTGGTTNLDNDDVRVNDGCCATVRRDDSIPIWLVLLVGAVVLRRRR